MEQGEISRHTALSVLDRFLPFFPFTPPRGTRRNFLTHSFIGQRPIFLFCFLSRHLVAQGEISRLTAISVPDRFFSFSFPFTPPRGKEQKSPTHCSIGPRPISSFFYTTSWHRAEVHDALLKWSTQLCGQTNK